MTKSFLTFQLGSQAFAIDALLVSEVQQQLTINPVPQAPAIIKGLVNLRGQIITLFDLQQPLKIDHEAAAGANHCIILKNASDLLQHPEYQTCHLVPFRDKVGFLVNQLGEVITTEAQPSHNPADTLPNAYYQGSLQFDKQVFQVIDTIGLFRMLLDTLQGK